MGKKITIAVIIIIVIIGGIAAYLFWQRVPPQSEPQQVAEPVPVEVGPAPPPPIIIPPAAPPALPALADSDKFMLDELAGLLSKDTLRFFFSKHIILKIVATIDNLPRKRLPTGVIPVKRVPGPFLVESLASSDAISRKNADRYSGYMRIIESIDARSLVMVYVRLYPLFQQAYEEIGYPGRYFNDRLLVAIDNLLGAPDLKEPVKVVRPNVFYLYADPGLEARSSGQKILMRIGSHNEAKVKVKLREIKRQIILHMQKKTDNSLQ